MEQLGPQHLIIPGSVITGAGLFFAIVRYALKGYREVQKEFVPQRECLLRHESIDKELADAAQSIVERRQSIHDLRDILTPLVTRVALVENDLGHVTQVVESIAERVGANGFVPRSKRRTE